MDELVAALLLLLFAAVMFFLSINEPEDFT